MDIYSFMYSPDIVAHCKAISHVFSPLDMAVIVAISEKPLAEKLQAWREILAETHDMPISGSFNFGACDSLHDYLQELIVYEEKKIEDFYSYRSDVVCCYSLLWKATHWERNDGFYSCVKTAWEACFKDISENKNDISQAKITVGQLDTGTKKCEAYYNQDGELLRIDIYSGEERPDDLDMIFIHIPVPFSKGDLVACDDEVYVLDWLPHWDTEKPGITYSERVAGGDVFSDGSDMISSVYDVSDEGVLFWDHGPMFYQLRYYNGKLEGAKRLLHYASLFIKGNERRDGLGLVELMTMQCRIMMEQQLANELSIKTHGCFITDSLLAENRTSEEEKEQIRQGNALAPWVAGILTIEQVRFLAAEFECSMEEVQNELQNGGGWYLMKCAGIVHQENHFEKSADSRFDANRRATAKLILEGYGKSEDGWRDSWSVEN